MASYPCIRYRHYNADGSPRKDWVTSLSDTQVWWGVPKRASQSNRVRYTGHQSQAKNMERTCTAKLRKGYTHLDYAVINDQREVVLEGCGSEQAAILRMKTMNGQITSPEVPVWQSDSVLMQWTLTVQKGFPNTWLRMVVERCAAKISEHLPEYTPADTEALLTQLSPPITSRGLVAAGTAIAETTTKGSILQDGTFKTFGDLLIIYETAREIGSYHPKDARLTTYNKTLKKGVVMNDLDTLKAAGLDPDNARSPAMLATVALELLTPKMDLSGAPCDDFYL